MFMSMEFDHYVHAMYGFGMYYLYAGAILVYYHVYMSVEFQ